MYFQKVELPNHHAKGEKRDRPTPQENFFKLFHSIRYLLEVIYCRHPVRQCFQYFSFVNTRRAKRTQDYLTIT